MSIKLVVFDIAGTTVRDENKVGAAFQAALATYGFKVPVHDTAPFMGYEKNQAIRDILKKFYPGMQVDDQTVEGIHQEFISSMIHYYNTSDEIEPLPYVEDTLQALHALGIKVAINTGFSRDIADAIVRKLQWLEKGLVDFIIASDEVERGRPYPDMIHELMRLAGIDDPKEVAKVGDTEVDIMEGRKAGCAFSIGITTGAYTRSQLAEHNPSYIMDDMRELLAIVNP